MNKLSACLLAAAVLAGGRAYAADAAQVEHGAKVFQYWCATCHGASMEGMGGGPLPGTLSLMIKYKNAKPGVLEQRTDLTPEVVKLVVRQGIQSMPFFRKTEVSDTDLDAVAAYLTRNTK